MRVTDELTSPQQRKMIRILFFALMQQLDVDDTVAELITPTPTRAEINSAIRVLRAAGYRRGMPAEQILRQSWRQCVRNATASTTRCRQISSCSPTQRAAPIAFRAASVCLKRFRIGSLDHVEFSPPQAASTRWSKHSVSGFRLLLTADEIDPGGLYSRLAPSGQTISTGTPR